MSLFSILPSVDPRLLVTTILFVVSAFVLYGFRAVRAADRIASVLYKERAGVHRVHGRIIWLNTLATTVFTLYLLAFVLSRVKLCWDPTDQDESFNPSECTNLTAWFQPDHLLLARAMLEVVTTGFNLFWVVSKFYGLWSRYRLTMVISGSIVLQIFESGSVLYYNSGIFKKSTIISVTTICASIGWTIASVIYHSKLWRWQKALRQPVIVLHPETNIWYPRDGISLDETRIQVTSGGVILLCHYLYHVYVFTATLDFTPFDLTDPYSLPQNSLLVLLGSLLAIGHYYAYKQIAHDPRFNDPDIPPKDRSPFFLVLKEGRVVACTAENRAELQFGGYSLERLVTDLEGRDTKTEGLLGSNA